MSVTIELPPQEEQIAFNLKRWEELSHDEIFAKVDQRIETNRYGHLIMSPYAGGWHGAFEMKIGMLISNHADGGTPIAECPISTSDGVKLADVGWYSDERFAEVRDHLAYPKAPEICVEVISPSNTSREIEEKRQLYFEAGCEEFWTCNRDGALEFFDCSDGPAISRSLICPDFPLEVTI